MINLPNAKAELIPNQIKESLHLWATKNTSDSVFVTSMQNMAKINLIRINYSPYEIYQLPDAGQTLLVKISGRTGDYQKRVPVFLTIIDPSGDEVKMTAQTLDTGVYQTSLVLSHKSKLGLYKISASYLGKEINQDYFAVKQVQKIVPLWFSNNIKWWNDGRISDKEFILSTQFLIDSGIIQIPVEKESMMQVLVNGKNAVRRGTIQSITILVNDGQKPIEGAHVFLRVEDYGEDILKEFDGFTDSQGSFLISWEIPKNAKQETLLAFIDVTDGIHTKSKVFTFDVWCLCGEPDCKCRN